MPAALCDRAMDLPDRSPSTPPVGSRASRVAVYVLFVVVAAVALDVPLYNRVEPSVAGVPFFYWFQTAWIVVAAGATFLAYRLGV
jgi:hypothetical protein